MAAGLAVVTALTWGIMEVLLLRVTKRAGAFTVALWISVFGGILTIPIVVMYAEPVTGGELAMGLVPGLLGVGAAFLYFTALRVGKLMVVSPTVATNGGIGALLAVVVLGETFEIGIAFAVVASVLGVVLASAAAGDRGATGVGWAAAAAVMFGVYTTGLAISTDAIGPVWTVFAYRVATVAVLVPVGLTVGRSLTLPSDIRSPVIVAALLETIGFVAFTVALGIGPVAVASVIMAQFATVAVVLAAVVLHERLLPRQWAGVAIVLASVTALGALR